LIGTILRSELPPKLARHAVKDHRRPVTGITPFS
jgi:hypothetical protein